MSTPLTESLALHMLGEGEWRLFADPESEAGNGMFGGWTAAALLKSVLIDPRAEGEASAINVTYVSRIAPTSDLVVRVRPLGGGRSVMMWRSEIFAQDGAGPFAAAHVVLTNKRATSTNFTEFKPPETPEPETLAMIHPPAAFGQRIDMRAWRMPFGNEDSHYSTWLRERTGHPVDHVLLAYLSDAYPPRVMGRSPGLKPSSTLTLTANFFATDAELAAIGDDFILNEAVGTRAEASTIGSQLRMWSRDGVLLATSEQLCWYR